MERVTGMETPSERQERLEAAAMSERTQDVEGDLETSIKRAEARHAGGWPGETPVDGRDLRAWLAEIRALRTDLEEAKAGRDSWHVQWRAAWDRVDRAEAALERKDAALREASKGMEMNLAEARAKINAARDDRADYLWREGVLVEARDAVDHAVDRLRALSQQPEEVEGGAVVHLRDLIVAQTCDECGASCRCEFDGPLMLSSRCCVHGEADCRATTEPEETGETDD